MNKQFTSIAVIGLGRIGLPSAILAAEKYERVWGIDHNLAYVKSLQDGVPPFIEKDLQQRLKTSRLEFTSQIPTAEIYLLALPSLGDDGRFTSKLVEKVLLEITSIAEKGIVIIESTLPLGAMEALTNKTKLQVVYCPERVAPGSVFKELEQVPRCIASFDEDALQKATHFYSTLGIKTIQTSPQIAETVKLSENAFRDANIAFANRLSEICADHGSQISEVIRIANTHPRVNILKPGLGAGGACLAPSTRSLDSTTLFAEVRSTNEAQIHRVLQAVQNLSLTSVSLWGLSYKPDCDDLRFSKAGELRVLLESKGIGVKTWDPVAQVGNYEGSLESDAIIFGVAHRIFKDDELAQRTRAKTTIKYVIDFVDAIDIAVWNKEGFSCICA